METEKKRVGFLASVYTLMGVSAFVATTVNHARGLESRDFLAMINGTRDIAQVATSSDALTLTQPWYVIESPSPAVTVASNALR